MSHRNFAEQDESPFVDSNHPKQLLAGLNSMRQSGQFCDVILCVEGEEFPAHRNVLSSTSEYFRALFTSDMAEKSQERVTLNGVEKNVINLIVQYAYTSEINITESNVQSLLSAANLLQVVSVREACCRFMLRHTDESNVIGVHCFAEAHAHELVAKSKDFILDNFVDVCRREEFLELNEPKLIEIISDDEIYVKSEETILNATIRWRDHDTSRGPNFHRVLEHIRTTPRKRTRPPPNYVSPKIPSRVLPGYSWPFSSESNYWQISPVGVAIARQIYALDFHQKCLHRFDPVAESWSKFDLSSPTFPLPWEVGTDSVTVLEDNIYFFGGWDKNRPSFDDTWVISLTGQVERLSVEGDKPSPRWQHGCWTYEGQIVFFGGQGPKPQPGQGFFVEGQFKKYIGDNCKNDQVISFDPVAKTFSLLRTKGQKPPPMFDLCTTKLGDQIFVLPRYSSDSFYRLDMTDLTWTKLSPPTTNLKPAALVPLSRTQLMLFAREGAVMIYDVEENSWMEEEKKLSSDYYRFASAIMEDDRVTSIVTFAQDSAAVRFDVATNSSKSALAVDE